MNLFGKPRGTKYHSRIIEAVTYEYDEQRLVVEGTLTDHRFQVFHLATGEKKSPGILHNMVIHLLVNKTTLEIEDINVKMPCVPREDCLNTINSIDSVKGLRVTSGYTAKVKELAGNGKGCNHLVALLAAMGAPVIQGYAAYHLHHSPVFIGNMTKMLADSCWAWRKNGPMFKMIKEKIEAMHQQ